MSNLPNVSILMPTYNRKHFCNLIIDNIVKQTYPKELLELVILDDGTEKLINDEISFQQLIHPIKLNYIYNKEKSNIGVKRNLLVNQASHEICINMDDDDIYLKDYILISVSYLLKKNAGLVGSNEMIFYFIKQNKFTKIICNQYNQIHENTMCFTKVHWNKTGGFLPVNTGEGPGMIDNYEMVVKNIKIDKLMILVCHENNTCDKGIFLENDIIINNKEINNKINFIKNIF